MKRLSTTLGILVLAIAAISCVTNTSSVSKNNVTTKNGPQATVREFTPIAVVELFTSQGCSSCPPADALLTRTIQADQSKNIYALSFHVDYWDRLGWKDPFSNKKYSQRQYDYVRQMQLSSAYTPQMLVNGEREFVGSNASSLQAALVQALKTPTTASFCKLSSNNDGIKVTVNYQLNGDINNKLLNVALVSEQEITKIKRGENGGRTLQSNNVVKVFVTVTPEVMGQVNIEKIEPGTTETKQAIIIYLQDKETLKISAAARLAL